MRSPITNVLFLTTLFLLVTVPNLLFPQRWLINFLAPYICPDAVYFKKTAKPLIALTIDDSPDRNTTSKILDILAQYGVVATFFPISDNLAADEPIIKAIVSNGHEVGNHLTKDELSISLKENFERELNKASQVLSNFTTTKWMRPGGGWCNQSMIHIAHKYNYQVALGSVWAYDTHIPSSSFAVWFILNNTKPGSIIVLHDVGNRGVRTAKILDRVIPKLQQQGYQFVTLSNLMEN